MSAWLRSVTGRAHQPSLTTQTAKAAAPKRAVRWRALARAYRELRLGKPSNTSGLSEDRRAETDTARAALLIGVYSYYYLSKSSRPAQIWARHFLPQRHEERKDGSKGIPPLRSSCSLRFNWSCELWLRLRCSESIRGCILFSRPAAISSAECRVKKYSAFGVLNAGFKMGCAFCHRKVPTRGHHVVPRCKGGREVAPTCRSCEDFIHKTWTHNELRDTFNTIGKIQADPRFQKFLRWLHNQQESAFFRTRRNRSRSSHR